MLQRLTRGRFIFLRPEADSIRRAIPDLESVLPEPQRIFLEDEKATPLVGFPLLRTSALNALDDALLRYIELEEEVQTAYVKRTAFDARAYGAAWQACERYLEQAIEHTTTASVSQNFPAVFWLYISSLLGRRLRDVPKNLRRRDLALGREQGDAVEYRILFKVLDRLVDLTYDVVQRLASKDGQSEDGLYPPLLDRLRDNVLIFSQDHISPDLSELSAYFHGHLQIDGRQLRQRLRATLEWYRETSADDPFLAGALPHLLGREDRPGGLSSPLNEPGFARFLLHHPDYDRDRLLTAADVEVWEGLLSKLKEFELFHAVRRMIVPMARENGNLVSRDRSANTTWVGGPPVLRLSATTRPYDLMAPMVVDPLVRRFGLVYDISAFSATLMMLGRAEASVLGDSFRQMMRFQRQVNRLASSLRLTLEKYLGDGAFFSGRRAPDMLMAAIRFQRIYSRAVEDGFPFDRGLRLALNFGQYRLLPLASDAETRAARYEFFGHGLVELSRLATGKATRDLDELKTYMVTQGYPELTVNKFFAPLQRRSTEWLDHDEQQRRFFAYINSSGVLINEGIVATEDFVARLGAFETMRLAQHGGRRYIVLDLETELGGALDIGIRKLGMGQFKGLGQLAVYEIVDGAQFADCEFRDLAGQTLMGALQRLFAVDVSRRLKRADDASS